MKTAQGMGQSVEANKTEKQDVAKAIYIYIQRERERERERFGVLGKGPLNKKRRKDTNLELNHC